MVSNGDFKERTYRGASIIELIHTATLVHDDVVDDVEDRSHRAVAAGERDAEQHVADLADDVEGEDAPHVPVVGRAEHAEQHGRRGHPDRACLR